MKIRIVIATAATMVMFAMPDAGAIEWIKTRDVKSVCQQFLTKSSSPSGYMCVSYIQGFLDGIKATEPARYEETGSHADDSRRYSMELAGVCLPRDAGVNEILRVVARGIADSTLEPRDPETSAIEALRRSYGCESDEQSHRRRDSEVSDLHEVSESDDGDDRN